MTKYTFCVRYKTIGYHNERQNCGEWKIEAEDHYSAFKGIVDRAEQRGLTLCEIKLKYRSNKLRHSM